MGSISHFAPEGAKCEINFIYDRWQPVFPVWPALLLLQTQRRHVLIQCTLRFIHSFCAANALTVHRMFTSVCDAFHSSIIKVCIGLNTQPPRLLSGIRHKIHFLFKKCLIIADAKKHCFMYLLSCTWKVQSLQLRSSTFPVMSYTITKEKKY